MELKDLTQDFIKGLRNNRSSDTFIYWNLFTILEHDHPGFLHEIIENYKEDPEDFFRRFHKSLRQWDVFGDHYAVYRNGVPTEEDEKRRKEILKWRKIFRRIHNNDDSVYEMEEYKESTKELQHVSRELRKMYVVERIGGHLDSIFYETIARDTDGKLYQYMNDFFKKNIKDVN
jgi:hypothetical protein